MWILDYLNVKAESPSLAALDQLVTAYTHRIPWESASRIVRKHTLADLAARPRFGNAFWEDAQHFGTGGTCYESNYAFFDLLQSLGYEGYLTINNMGESIGCHSAIIIQLDDQPYLVDVGLPIYLPLPLNPHQATTRKTPFHTYTIIPEANNQYQIERDLHPRPNCFTLINQPVDLATYRKIATQDYDDGGLFLDRVIVLRIVNDRVWRFDSSALPYQLESFFEESKTYHLLGLDADEVAKAVATHFQIDVDLMKKAINCLTEFPKHDTL